ncbi:MAG: alpha-L-fucosidase [Phycisphaerales bacterium]|nr:alpha-L-fucosidase [Phycisphaerales bacterium]
MMRAVMMGGVAIGMSAVMAWGLGEPPYEERASEAVRKVDEVNAKGPWKADMKALAAHEESPEWFGDAKFGIYFHWGVYSVPAFDNEWYPRNMHIDGTPANVHHNQMYENPTRFGYHELVPAFRAERFDAEEWARLFKDAGAKFAGPVFEHHDGYAMWGSKLTPWNAVETGPKRDIAGQMEKAIRAEGMKFIATFHHGFNGQFTEKENEANGYYPRREGWYTTSEDPRERMLYGNLPQKWSRDMWLGKLQEAIDGYKPDLIWFDFCVQRLPAEYQARFLAYYFNRASEWGREVVVTCKNHNFAPEIAVEDFEKGRMERLTPQTWLTDDTLGTGSWCYTDELVIRPAGEIVQVLADIVSKNGNLLLNISPMSNGSIPKDQRAALKLIGDWLKANGEAIYSTRPWLTAGEGPTKLGKGGHFVESLKYTSRDVRYTRSKDGKTLYAILLGWPEERRVTLRSVKGQAGAGGEGELLGLRKKMKWGVDEEGHVVVEWPEGKAEGALAADACVVKLPAGGLSLHDEALAELHPGLTLEASAAELDGTQIRVEEVDGKKSIGYWDRGGESVHWLVRVPEAGAYRVQMEVASEAANRVVLATHEFELTAAVPSTGSWRVWKMVEVGVMEFGKAGVHQVVLRPAEVEEWKAVNVRRVVLLPK